MPTAPTSRARRRSAARPSTRLSRPGPMSRSNTPSSTPPAASAAARSARSVNTNLPANFKSSLSYDANNAYLNLALNFIAAAQRRPQRQPAECRQRAGQFLQHAPAAFRWCSAALTPAGLTQVSGETATGSQQTTFDAMNLFMGLLTDPFIAGRGDAVAGACGAFARGGHAEPMLAGQVALQSERDAYAAIYRKAPVTPIAFDAALERVGGGLWRLADHRRQRGARIEHRNQPHRTASRSAPTTGSRRTRWPALRWPAAAPISALPTVWLRAIRPVPGRRLHPPQRRRGLSHRRAGLWLAGHHHRSHRDGRRHRPAARAVQRQCVVRAASKAAIALSTPWMAASASRLMPPAQFTTFDLPAYAEQAIAGANTFALAYGAKSVTATRSELGLRTRQILCDAGCDLDAARPCRLGARFQSGSRRSPRRSRRCPAQASSSTARRRRATPRSSPPPPK